MKKILGMAKTDVAVMREVLVLSQMNWTSEDLGSLNYDPESVRVLPTSSIFTEIVPERAGLINTLCSAHPFGQ